MDTAERILRLFYDAMEQNPLGFGHMLGALDFYLKRPQEIVLVGDVSASQTQEMLRRINAMYLPNKTLVCLDPQTIAAGKGPTVLAGKTQVDSELTIYVCHNFNCSLPVTEWGDLQELLLGEGGTQSL